MLAVPVLISHTSTSSSHSLPARRGHALMQLRVVVPASCSMQSSTYPLWRNRARRESNGPPGYPILPYHISRAHGAQRGCSQPSANSRGPLAVDRKFCRVVGPLGSLNQHAFVTVNARSERGALYLRGFLSPIQWENAWWNNSPSPSLSQVRGRMQYSSDMREAPSCDWDPLTGRSCRGAVTYPKPPSLTNMGP